MRNDPMTRLMAKVSKIPAKWLMLIIKLTQALMLLAGLAAFLYGVYELGQDLWYSVKGVPTVGHVIGSEEHHETRETFPGESKTSSFEVEYSSITVYRPIIRYRWPPENGEVYVHRSSIEFEGDEMDSYDLGNRVTIRVLPDAPEHARLSGGFTHYLWAGLGFAAGLFALVVVSSLFFLHEGLFGRDLSRGISLFRSLSLTITLVVLLVLTIGLQQLHQRVAPWIGFRELAAVTNGEIQDLPALLARKGEPEPGQFLNAAEQSFARLPWLGAAFASEALERALRVGDDAMVRRYLAAMTDPANTFPVQSNRALAYAAERGNEEFVRALLASGISPDSAPFSGWEPLRRAARRNHTAVMEVLLTAGARTEYPDHPLIRSALEGRSENAVRLLLEHTLLDPAWREPETHHTLADLALIQGMVDAADLLQEHGSSVTLPGYYRHVVTGNLKGLLKELPRPVWNTTRFQGATLLHLAARYRQPALARVLVALGADPNAQLDSQGAEAYTPLIEAVLAGDQDLVRFLARVPGTRLDRGDYRHLTPLAHAVRQNRWELAELLAEAGAAVNVQIGDYDGNTPLHVAAEKGDFSQIRWLLARGASPRMKNHRQLTPLDVARSSAVLEVLQEAGDEQH